MVGSADGGRWASAMLRIEGGRVWRKGPGWLGVGLRGGRGVKKWGGVRGVAVKAGGGGIAVTSPFPGGRRHGECDGGSVGERVVVLAPEVPACKNGCWAWGVIPCPSTAGRSTAWPFLFLRTQPPSALTETHTESHEFTASHVFSRHGFKGGAACEASQARSRWCSA